MTRWLLEPPTDRGGSRGDEALMRGALSVLPDARIFVPELWRETWPEDLPIDTGPRLDEYTHFALIGADCVDGAYGDPPLWMLWNAVGSKLQCRVVSFSMGETSTPDAVDKLRGLHHHGVRFIARDTVSQRRFAARVGRKCELGGDLAVLTPRERQRVKAGGVVVLPTQRALKAGALGPTVEAARQADRPVWVVPHDPRHDDEGACLTVAEAIGEHARIWPLSSVAVVRGLLARADLVISHRLHPALLAMAEGVPAVALSYGGKFEGAYMDLGVSELLTDDTSGLPMIARDVLRRSAEFREHVRLGAQAMARRAKASLEAG